MPSDYTPKRPNSTGGRQLRPTKRSADAPTLEPAEIGLTVCAGCGHRFADGDPYHRGLAQTKAGMGFYITCHPCAEVIRQDPCGSLASAMVSRLEDAILAAAPTAGAA